MEDLNIVVRERLEKAAELERQDIALYPNAYPVPEKIKDVLAAGGKTAEELRIGSNGLYDRRAGSFDSLIW